jgi:hypothetical protein
VSYLVYTSPHSRRVHVLGFGDGPNDRVAALCGVTPPFGTGWLGTGSQREYDRVAALPLCKRCSAKRGA